VYEDDAYRTLAKLSEEQLDKLIALLTVELLDTDLHYPTPFIGLLADELQVDVRQAWRPDAAWLDGYTKLQLAELLATLRGPASGHAAANLKKSELVTQVNATKLSCKSIFFL
jgi:hypothetical protein